MSYMRGACYIWRDDHHIHVWVEDGYDGWDENGWAEGYTHSTLTSMEGGRPSGVSMSQDSADAFVLMRLAELVVEQRVGAVVDAALGEFGGNGGCLALQKLATALVSALEPISSDPAAAEMRDLWNKARGE